MNLEIQLQKLDETRSRTIELVLQLDQKLARKEIDGLQYKIVLHNILLGKTKEEIISHIDNKKQQILEKIQKEKEQEEERKSQQNKKTIAITAMMLLVLMIGVIFTTQDGLTGYIIKDFMNTEPIILTTNQTYEQTLNYTNITSLKISGTIDKGSAVVKLRLEDGTELVIANLIATQTGTTYTLTTDKKTYLIGEQVNITLNPNIEQQTTYLYKGEEQTILTENTYSPTTLGEYKIVTIITESDNTARLEINFTVTETITEIEEQETITTTIGLENIFTNLCTETCNITTTSNPIIIIQPTDEATIKITDITTTTQKENNPPVQIILLENIQIIKGEEKQLDLSRYFGDLDDDILYYDVTATENISTIIDGTILILSSENVGEETINIYATDSSEITTSNPFKIVVVENELENSIENQTFNQTLNLTLNETLNETENQNDNETSNMNSSIQINQTNQTNNISPEINQTINLTNLDIACELPIDERPSACFEGEEAKFFKDIVATLSDSTGASAGRFNRFGNLIIMGELIENSPKQPSTLDFKIGYSEIVDYDEKIIVTVWIDKSTGDLHLKGKIYEEQQLLNPPQYDVYSINNKLGITVAYFDKKTGDLYLRGNLVRSGKI